MEVGPRDVEQGTCVVARRDRPGKEGKAFGVPMEPAPFVAAIQVRPPPARQRLPDEAQESPLVRPRSLKPLNPRSLCTEN